MDHYSFILWVAYRKKNSSLWLTMVSTNFFIWFWAFLIWNVRVKRNFCAIRKISIKVLPNYEAENVTFNYEYLVFRNGLSKTIFKTLNFPGHFSIFFCLPVGNTSRWGRPLAIIKTFPPAEKERNIKASVYY